MGAPLVDFDPKVDTAFAVKMPINQGFSDCSFPARPGQLFNEANPALAQAAMAGGRRNRNRSRRHNGGACGCSVMRGASRKIRGGGYAVDPSVNVGGNGPNVAPLHSSVPCDVRGGSPNPYNQVAFADPRAPADLYSATPNTTLPSVHAGGAYSSGNNWSADCYKAPGSQLPTYEAQTAGFDFYPSTAKGGVLPDGVTPYMDVQAQAARLGGARRKNSRKNRKNSRKNSRKSSRKNNRKNNRKH